MEIYLKKNFFFKLQIGRTTGRLHTFIVEPFCAHTDEDELYVAIYSQREEDVILFYEHGGIEIGDVDQVHTSSKKVELRNFKKSSIVKENFESCKMNFES